MVLVRADFHVHTRGDPQGVQRSSAEDYVLRAEELGLSVMAITNKGVLTYSEELAAFGREHNVLVVPGVEALVSGKEVLILNLDASRGGVPRTFEELADLRQNDPDVLTIAPHPYFVLGKCLKDEVYRRAELFDAIEYSYFYLRGFNPNRKAEEAAVSLGKPLVASSDAHQLDQLGRAFTWLEVPRTPAEGLTLDEVVAAVRQGHARPESSPLSLGRFLSTAALVATTKVNTPVRRKLRDLSDRRARKGKTKRESTEESRDKSGDKRD